MMQKTADPFIRRVRWLTIAVIAVLFAWKALSWADRAFQKESATPRAVTARGDLTADEKSTIELFERSRDSVVSNHEISGQRGHKAMI